MAECSVVQQTKCIHKFNYDQGILWGDIKTHRDILKKPLKIVNFLFTNPPIFLQLRGWIYPDDINRLCKLKTNLDSRKWSLDHWHHQKWSNSMPDSGRIEWSDGMCLFLSDVSGYRLTFSEYELNCRLLEGLVLIFIEISYQLYVIISLFQ